MDKPPKPLGFEDLLVEGGESALLRHRSDEIDRLRKQIQECKELWTLIRRANDRLRAQRKDLREKIVELEERLEQSETLNTLMYDELWEIIALVDKDVLEDQVPLHERVRKTLEKYKSKEQ